MAGSIGPMRSCRAATTAALCFALARAFARWAVAVWVGLACRMAEDCLLFGLAARGQARGFGRARRAGVFFLGLRAGVHACSVRRGRYCFYSNGAGVVRWLAV